MSSSSITSHRMFEKLADGGGGGVGETPRVALELPRFAGLLNVFGENFRAGMIDPHSLTD